MACGGTPEGVEARPGDDGAGAAATDSPATGLGASGTAVGLLSSTTSDGMAMLLVMLQISVGSNCPQDRPSDSSSDTLKEACPSTMSMSMQLV